MNFEAQLLQTVSEKDFLDENDIRKYINFEKYHKTRTTSIAERTERIKILSNVICE